MKLVQAPNSCYFIRPGISAKRKGIWVYTRTVVGHNETFVPDWNEPFDLKKLNRISPEDFGL